MGGVERVTLCLSTGTGTSKNGACSTGTGIGALLRLGYIPAGQIGTDPCLRFTKVEDKKSRLRNGAALPNPIGPHV